MRNLLFKTSLALLLVCSSANAKEELRIDASSDASTEATWKQMIDSAPPKKKRELAVAMLKLNMEGVNSAYEAIGPEYQSLGILGIKAKVAGLTADEIIDLANRTSAVTVEPQGK